MDANGNSTGYPWSSGDVLLAADLNSAIANAGALSAGAYSKVFSVEAFGAKGDRKQYSGTLTCASGLNPTLTIAGADLSAVKPGQLVVLPLGGAAGAGVKATVASVVGSAIALVGSVATALSNIAFQATGTPTIATAGVGVSPLDVYTLVDGPFPALIPAQVMVVTTKVVTVTANTNGSGGIDGSYTFQGTSGAQTLFQFTATVASGALVPASIVLTRAGVYQKAPANIAAEPIVDVGGISGLVNATVKLVMGANGTAILGRSGSGPPVIDENGIELFGQPGSVATVVVPGGYSAIPPNPVSTTGPGTGVTLIVNWASPTVIIGTDNAPMINAALDAIRAQGTGSPRVTVNAKLVFSTASDYLVNDALNVTELSALMIDGQRAAIYSCANGLPVFDEMSSNDITNINVCVAGDPTFPPRWCFQYGYTRPGAPAPRMTFDQLLLTGSFSDAGFDYNFASESINMGLVQANIRAPYSRIMDACNSSYWNVTSKYIPTTIARDAPVSFIGGTSGQISLINSHPAGSSVWMLGGTGHNYTDAYLYSHQEAFVINVSTLTGTAGLLADHCHIEGSRHAFYGQQAPTNGKPSWTFSRLSYSDSLSFVSEAIYGLADNVLHTGFFNHTINVGFQSATAKYFDDPSRIVYSGTVIGSEGTIKRWTNNQPASMTGIVVVFGGVPPQTLIYNATGEDDTLLNGMLSVSGAVQTGSSLSVSNGAVASVHVSFGGFYTNPDFPTVAIDPPASGVTALATVTGMSWFAAKDAIVAAGTGYVVGDVFTLVGGTHAVAASASVVSVNGTGGVTGVAIVNPGQYSAYPPAGATTTTGGSGTGLVMGGSIWGVIARDTIGVTVTVPGSGYTSFPNVAFSNPVSGDPQARGTVLMGTAWYADSTGAHGTFTGTIGSGSTGAFLPLTGGLISGHLNVNGTSTTWTSTATSGSTSSFISQGSHTSASHLSGGATINLFSVGTDTLQADNVNIMQIVANTSGAAQGTRQGLAVQLFQTSATATGGGWNALATIAEGRFSNGGTGLTATAALGSVFGFNPYARVLAGATNWAQCIGGEIDISVREPTGIFRKSGLQIVVDSADVGHGVGQDSGLTFATQTGGAGVRDLVELGNGLSQFPLYAAGDTSIMRVYTGQNALTYGMRANRGLDMLEADITSWQFRGRGFAVHGSNFVSGAVQIGNGVIQPIAGGIQISSPGNVGTGTPTVAAGGSGYLSNDILYDGYGGVYRATAAGGVTAVTVLRQPFVPGAAPSNPVATTTWAATNLGTGCTLNLSWTAGSAVQIGAVGNTTTFGGTHTAGNPCFHATLSATQSVTSGVATKCNFNVEAFDSDNAYDNATNYRFTPQKAGRYHVTASIAVGAGGTSGATFSASIYKNGVEYTRNQWSSPNTNSYSNTQITTAIVAMNGTTDYLEGWGVATGTTAPAFAGTISYMEANYIGA